MPNARSAICPACNTAFSSDLVSTPEFACPHCGARIFFSQLHLLAIALSALIASLVICYFLRLKVSAAPAWIPIYIVCFVFSAQIAGSLSSPLKVGAVAGKSPGVVARNLKLFLAFWFGCVVVALCYGYIGGLIALIVGGSTQDLSDVTDMWSVPLALVNSSFWITPDESFVEVIGIVVANGYFYALALTAIFRIVHGLLRRNRVVELGIGGTTVESDDDEV